MRDGSFTARLNPLSKLENPCLPLSPACMWPQVPIGSVSEESILRNYIGKRVSLY